MENINNSLNTANSAPEMGQNKNNRSSWFFFNRWEGMLLYMPAIILILVLKGWPLIQGFYLSLTTQEVVGKNVFVGLANYHKLFTDKIFLTSIVNILKSFIALPFFIIIPLVIAFLIHQRVPGWKFFRATYLFSYLLAPVMVGYMFSFLLGSRGPINVLLKAIGLDALAINWLGNPRSSIFVVFGVILWSWFGLGALIYLASMATVEEQLYESAKLDGANSMQVLFHITIPHILPTIGYWSVLVTTSFFIGLFPFIFSLTEGGPGYATMMPEYYIYITATKFLNPGYASAMGVVLFFVIFILSLVQIKLMYSNELS
ncbi:MAG: carbohydrate ABC transporter permease [Candidatus Humimicrobiaceae bacterium]